MIPITLFIMILIKLFIMVYYNFMSQQVINNLYSLKVIDNLFSFKVIDNLFLFRAFILFQMIFYLTQEYSTLIKAIIIQKFIMFNIDVKKFHFIMEPIIMKLKIRTIDFLIIKVISITKLKLIMIFRQLIQESLIKNLISIIQDLIKV